MDAGEQQSETTTMCFRGVLVAILVSSVHSEFSCPKSLNLTDDMRANFLNTHNDLRRNIAYGEQENKNGFLGPAKNMYQLEWDCELERQAQESLSKCTLIENVNAGRNNIAMSMSNLPDDIYASLAMSTWVDAVKYLGKANPTNAYDGTLCQFANMVHANTTKIGCSFKRCADNVLVTCLYDKCGTLPNSLMWESGEPCEHDDDCTTFYGSECWDGLCIRAE